MEQIVREDKKAGWHKKRTIRGKDLLLLICLLVGVAAAAILLYTLV